MPKERWDEADPAQDADDEMSPVSAGALDRAPRNILPDWTRTPLPAGAPPAIATLSVSPQAVEA